MDDTEKPVGFAGVKAILDSLVSGHGWDDLTFVHGNAFGWADKAALANAVVRPFSSSRLPLDRSLACWRRPRRSPLASPASNGCPLGARMRLTRNSLSSRSGSTTECRISAIR
jgi:hypothetical protein